MEPLDAVLVLYHHYPSVNAPTIMEHATSFERYSQYPVISLNTDDGFPPALEDLAFKVIVIHYSLFPGPVYVFGDRFLRYLEKAAASTKIVFFQDEHHNCPQRFAFIDRYGIDIIYSVMEPPYDEEVYLKHSSTHTVRSTLTGYVSDELIERSKELFVPDANRTVDVGYRARRLAFYMGRGSQEKHEIGDRFVERAADLGLELDIATGEHSRIYGDAWYRFVANCRAMLGVEAGTSVFDLEDTARPRTFQLLAEQPNLSFDEVERLVLHEYEGRIPYRTISPRHFEAAAFRVVQILYEGRYNGVLQPDVHYLELKKDWSNFDDVMARFADPNVRRTITDQAYEDLIASGRYSYRSFIAEFDKHLADLPLRRDGLSDDERRAVERRLDKGSALRKIVTRARTLRTRPFRGRRAIGNAYRWARRRQPQGAGS